VAIKNTPGVCMLLASCRWYITQGTPLVFISGLVAFLVAQAVRVSGPMLFRGRHFVLPSRSVSLELKAILGLRFACKFMAKLPASLQLNRNLSWSSIGVVSTGPASV
jgi:hypothetical protein